MRTAPSTLAVLQGGSVVENISLRALIHALITWVSSAQSRPAGFLPALITSTCSAVNGALKR